jgi:tRNA threonylcarbamoyladenosine biosynthesis protein TsaE
MKQECITYSVSQTKNLGKKLAQELLNSLPKEKALVIALEGELGSGKTTFLQGFAKGLGIKDRILSPTFVILKNFRLPTSNFKYFYHIDCYRIKKPEELLTLGFKGIISNPRNIVAIEWAEKMAKLLPKESIILDFKFKKEKEREIVIKSIC